MRHHLLILLLLLPLLISPAAAAASPADDEFDAGARAFREQDYRQALYHFTRAEKAGMRAARLDYNFGVVFYRLEQYAESRRYFEKLQGHPTLGALALAYYNLGLIAHKSGDRAGAIDWFEKCAEISADDNLAELANQQIAKLGGRQPKPWFGYVSAVYGYDSNITLLPSSAAADESGDFVQALALGEYALREAETESYHLTALLLATDFLDGSDFDDDLLVLGAEYRRRAGDWRLDYRIEFGTSTFGGEDYVDTVATGLSARTELDQDRELRLRLTLEDVSEGSSEFAFLDGSRAELWASYRIDVDRREYRFEYGLEANDRENTATESFSPTYHRFRLRYFDQISTRIELGASFEFRDFRRHAPRRAHAPAARGQLQTGPDLDDAGGADLHRQRLERRRLRLPQVPGAAVDQRAVLARTGHGRD
jgi:tetratricopeptide (TPR) repeat protein